MAEADPLRRAVTIANRRGLHARASAKFVSCVSRFKARVHVSRDGQRVAGDSILDLMMLAAGPGARLIIEARGIQRREALDALAALIENRFEEGEK